MSEQNGEITFEKLNLDEMHTFLDIIGYETDEDGVIIDKETKEEYISPVTEQTVFIENASVLPGSTIIVDTSELSLSEYFTKYLESNL